MNKKWLMLFASSLLSVLLLAGCGADDADPAPPGTEDDGMGQELEQEGEELENEVEEVVPGTETDEMTPADETTPGETEEGEGTPGEADEDITEDPEANMDEDKNNAGAGDQGTTNQ